MKILINSKVLHRAIAPMLPIVGNSLVPILDNIYFNVLEEHQLEVVGFNLTTSITVQVPVETITAGHCLIPAWLLCKLLKHLTEQPIVIEEVQGTKIIITTEDGIFKLPSYEVMTFPKWPLISAAFHVVSVSASNLRAVERVLPFCGKDQLRPALMCVHIDLRKNDLLECTASDGHHLMTVQFIEKEISVIMEQTLLVPAAALILLLKALQSWKVLGETSVDLFVKEHILFFKIGQYCLSTKLFDERYPDFKGAFPSGNASTQATVERIPLLSKLKRAKFFSNDFSNVVHLKLHKDEYEIVSKNLHDESESTQKGMCEAFIGKGIAVHFNAKLLIKGLQHLPDDKLTMYIQAANKGVVIVPLANDPYQKWRYLIMPIMNE